MEQGWDPQISRFYTDHQCLGMDPHLDGRFGHGWFLFRTGLSRTLSILGVLNLLCDRYPGIGWSDPVFVSIEGGEVGCPLRGRPPSADLTTMILYDHPLSFDLF